MDSGVQKDNFSVHELRGRVRRAGDIFVKPFFFFFRFFTCTFILLGNSYRSSVEIERQTVGTPKHDAMLTGST